MNLKLNLLSKAQYDNYRSKLYVNFADVNAMARYPFVSLIERCKNLSKSEYEKVKDIEDLNIFYFLSTVKLVCGIGTEHELATFHRAITEEPLRTAVLLGQAESNPTDKYITFMVNAIKILLSPKDGEGGGIYFRDPVNVGIVGNMPRDLFKSRQEIGNVWYKEFVNQKMELLFYVCKYVDKTKVFPIMMMSIAYSLYAYTPERYRILENSSEDENIHIILNSFINHIEKIRNK